MIYAVFIGDSYYGFHEKKKVAISYARKYAKSNPLEKKIRVDVIDSLRYTDTRFLDYWLEPINRTFVPNIYYDIMEDISFNSLDHHKKLENKLKELMTVPSLSKKEKKAILEVLVILKKRRKACEIYTPSIRILNDGYWRMCEYRDSYVE